MSPVDPYRSSAPLVSVVMANYHAGDKIVAAMQSVLKQSMPHLELIVSDDASADDSLAHVRRLMREDGRIRLLTSQDNGGPARCRNRALDQARGRWIAIVDSDDLIHPERFERLLAAAEDRDADIIADDLLLFFDDGSAPQLLLDTDAPFMVTAAQWIRAGTDGSPALGYLKPLIRADALGPLRYDENLRIGEDHDLVLRLLLGEARMHVIPEPYYLYRRYSGSISHRLSIADLQAMIDRQDALVQAHPSLDWRVLAAFSRRLRGLRKGLVYERLVDSIKSRRALDVLAALAADPGLVRRLWRSYREGRRHRQLPPAREPSPLLTLGAAETTGANEPVPSYTPVAAADWNAPSPRRIWRDLAARRGLGAVRCIPLDQAGRYAAGFIPEAEILPLQAKEEEA